MPKGDKPPEIVDFSTFVKVHQWADERIKTYLEAGRPDWQQLSMDVCGELEVGRYERYSAVDLLYANNAESRINFARIALGHVRAHPALGAEEPTAFFVTLTPEQFGMHERDASSFDTRIIQAWTRYVLAGFDFISMVEAGFFPEGRDRASKVGSLRGRVPMVSWHVHLLVWNTPYWKLNRALAKIKRDHPSFVVGTPSATCCKLETPEATTLRTLYMLKAPQKRSRVSRYQREFTHDPSTGEVVAKPHFNKDWLRTGQRVRMCRVMADRYLDRLFFGQGDGTVLRRAIANEALKNFEQQKLREEHQDRYRREVSGSGRVPPKMHFRQPDIPRRQ